MRSTQTAAVDWDAIVGRVVGAIRDVADARLRDRLARSAGRWVQQTRPARQASLLDGESRGAEPTNEHGGP